MTRAPIEGELMPIRITGDCRFSAAGEPINVQSDLFYLASEYDALAASHASLTAEVAALRKALNRVAELFDGTSRSDFPAVLPLGVIDLVRAALTASPSPAGGPSG